MRGTKENLKSYAVRALASWLINAARRRSLMTYGEAKLRLEAEEGFDTIFPLNMGVPAGELMYRLLDADPDCLCLPETLSALNGSKDCMTLW